MQLVAPPPIIPGLSDLRVLLEVLADKDKLAKTTAALAEHADKAIAATNAANDAIRKAQAEIAGANTKAAQAARDAGIAERKLAEAKTRETETTRAAQELGARKLAEEAAQEKTRKSLQDAMAALDNRVSAVSRLETETREALDAALALKAEYEGKLAALKAKLAEV